MGYKQDRMMDRASRAIRAVHDDTSASLEQALDTLESLRDELDTLISGIKENIRREKPAESIEGYYNDIYD